MDRNNELVGKVAIITGPGFLVVYQWRKDWYERRMIRLAA